MIKNFAYAAWAAAYIIFLHEAYIAKNDELWVLFLILIIQMPLILWSLVKSIPAALSLRAVLVCLQLPFALMFFFRHAMPSKWFGLLIMVYLGLSALIAATIRRKFPQDVNKF